MDTVIGKRDKSSCLLVFTERKTREEIILKIKDKTQYSVRRALNNLEKSVHNFKDVFKTITVDNGSEFLNQRAIEKSCKSKTNRTQVFYCHPYSSWERGSNENSNKLIRRFIPKGTPIEYFSDEYIQKIQFWINHLPRKILGYKTSAQLVKEYNI